MNATPYVLDFSASTTVDVDAAAAGLLSTVVPVFFIDNLLPKLVGTAFCIATLANGEAIYATAGHVLEKLKKSDALAPFTLLPHVGQLPSPLTLRHVPIEQISYADSYSDVSVFVVNTNRNVHTAGLQIGTLPVALSAPVEGTECVAVGYPEVPGIINFQMVAVLGTIEELHPDRRDNFALTWPSFRTNANYQHGMSGGPVWDTNGHVVGVVSMGFDAVDGFIGYAAILASIMELKVDLHDAGGQVHERTIKSLIESGVITTHGKATLERSADGITLNWHPT